MQEWPSLREAVRRLLKAPSQTVEPATPCPDKTIIVRRGLSEDFYFFLDVFARHNNTAMVVDRRASDRRRFSREAVKERRHDSDRRAASSSPWTKENFFIERNPLTKN